MNMILKKETIISVSTLILVVFILTGSAGGDSGGGMSRVSISDRLNSGDVLKVGYSIISQNGQYRLTLQNNGNFVLYNLANNVIWESGTLNANVSEIVMRNDGNLVMNDYGNMSIWSTDTYGNPGAYLILQNSGNAVIYSATGGKLWSQPLVASLHMLRFITIGDPHLRRNVTDDEEQRLAKAVNYINGRNDIDFVVVMGDLANDGTIAQFHIGKSILNGLNKPYYVVEGNHDILIDNLTFSNYFGPAENIINVNGYQLLFVGIWSELTHDGSLALHWSFDFNNPRINKKMPTVVFLHGLVQNAPSGCCKDGTGSTVNWNNDVKYYKFAWDMQPELNKFSKLIGVYSGHVHVDTVRTVSTPSKYPVQYITIASLTDNKLIGWLAPPSDNIGYSVINNGKLKYNLVNYTVPIPKLKIVPPVNIVQMATGLKTFVNIGRPTISGGIPPYTISNNSPPGNKFPVGQTTVLWTVTDSVDTTGQVTQLITITPAKLTITAPANVTKVATGLMTKVNIGMPKISGGIPPYTLSNNMPQGNSFPVGKTTIIWMVTDWNGTTAQGTQLVTITSQTDIEVYYRNLGLYPNILETNDLLKAADDWRNNIVAPGFSVSITTGQLLALANEWRNS